MEWPTKPSGQPVEPPYAAACASFGAVLVLIPVAIGARLNDVPGSFWWWFAGGFVLALVFYGLVWLLDYLAGSARDVMAPPPPVDDWAPAFTEAEYVEIRKKVPFAGIVDSGGPGYSDGSQRVEELLYDAPSTTAPRVPAAVTLAMDAAALDIARARAAASGIEAVPLRPASRKPARQR